MKKRILFIGLALLLAAAVGCAGLLTVQRSLADKLVRLHVVANSDEANDQNLKLAVRDALLEAIEPMSRQAATKNQMVEALNSALPELKKTAERTLRRLGCSDGVEIGLGEESFPTRFYETFALPAGRYTALRVRLGSAEGRNWWCVCFPGLCTSACAEDFDAVAAGAGFSEEELRLITGKGDYKIRFKVLEWLEALRRRACGEA